MPRKSLKPNGAARKIKRAAKAYKPKTKSAVLQRRLRGGKTVKVNGAAVPIEIDIQELEDLTASVLNCPVSELATMLGMDPKTLKRKIKTDAKLRNAYKRGKRRARFTLRQIQANTAAAGDSRIQIWLGKNYLSQVEPTNKHEFTGNVDLAVGATVLADRLSALIAREQKTISVGKAESERSDPPHALLS